MVAAAKALFVETIAVVVVAKTFLVEKFGNRCDNSRSGSSRKCQRCQWQLGHSLAE